MANAAQHWTQPPQQCHIAPALQPGAARQRSIGAAADHSPMNAAMI
jgi:hypothetical protein